MSADEEVVTLAIAGAEVLSIGDSRLERLCSVFVWAAAALALATLALLSFGRGPLKYGGKPQASLDPNDVGSELKGGAVVGYVAVTLLLPIGILVLTTDVELPQWALWCMFAAGLAVGLPLAVRANRA